MQRLKKLNLGCGKDQLPHHINLDILDYGQEIVRDVKRGLPFNSCSFNKVVSYHMLEHIPPGTDLIFVVSEVWRVLVPGGLFEFTVPAYTSPWACYPNHKSFWNEETVHALVGDYYHGADKYSFKLCKCKHVDREIQAILKKL